jgi:hypothetical protein
MTITKQDEFFEEEKFDSGYPRIDSLGEVPPNTSWERVITAYRDFFFSAFADRYTTVRFSMLVVCFLYGKTWASISPTKFDHRISNSFDFSLTGILLRRRILPGWI